MVDYYKIGKRIQEERKHILKLSQERMAEELGMYQADISNLEKAKNGSGITDLSKLDLIAEYLGMPLETLIFGQEGKNMPVYHGDSMKLKKTKKKTKKAHAELLLRLMGAPKEADIASLGNPPMYTCGPYEIYCPSRMLLGFNKESNRQYKIFQQQYFYVFFGNEVAAIMVTDVTGIMQHIFQPALAELQTYIPATVLDVTDSLRTINPYWALYRFAENEQEEENYFQPMLHRMDEIRAVAQEDNILYIENIYVREDFRKKGICRMLLDLLKEVCGDQVTWLNMEPTTGSELSGEYGHMPSYTASELGQLNMNAAIAERLGFTVDPDTWHIQAETMDDDGNISVEILKVRKCAYRLPKKIRNITKNDGDLVALGRAKQKLQQQNDEGHCEMDLRDGNADDHIIYEQKIRHIGGKDGGKTIFCYAAISEKTGKIHYGVSVRSPIDNGIEHDGILEHYTTLDDAKESEYYDALNVVDALLPRIINDEIMSNMDMYDTDCQHLMGTDDDGNGIVILNVKPSRGKWAFKQLYGTAFYIKEEESVRFEVAEKSYQDVIENTLSQEEYEKSVLEDYLSEDGSLPLPDKTDFYLMYFQMQQLIVQQIIENCHQETSDSIE